MHTGEIAGIVAPVFQECWVFKGTSKELRPTQLVEIWMMFY